MPDVTLRREPVVSGTMAGQSGKSPPTQLADGAVHRRAAIGAKYGFQRGWGKVAGQDTFVCAVSGKPVCNL